MAQRVAVAARTTAVLTGGGAVDYAADLDMNLVADGVVTVGFTVAKGAGDSVAPKLFAGPAATPTQPISNGIAVLSETITDANATRTITVQTNQRYFRAGAAQLGAGGVVGSDAVINYYYKPICANSGM